MKELKSCPFCGNVPQLRQIGEEWKVECISVDCEALPSTYFHDTKEEAIEAWNRRASNDTGRSDYSR